METKLIEKYGLSFIVYANLWEVELALSPDELVVAREMRMSATAKIGKRE